MNLFKKKGLALLLALAMALSLLPTAALASEAPSRNWEDYVSFYCDDFGSESSPGIP